MYVNRRTLDLALKNLYGTAGHLLKIWFTLKHMGLDVSSPPVKIDTSNSTGSLQRLFSFGDPDGRFYIPFAHTPRYLTMKHDAARSIIQTTIQRWASSGSVVTCDPTAFLDITNEEGGALQVRTGRRYPLGLGIGESGFALQDDIRVSVPITSFAVWFGRQTRIPNEVDPEEFIVSNMLKELNISQAERDVIFVDDDLPVETRASSLTDDDILSACQPYVAGSEEPTTVVHHEEFSHYEKRVKGMVSGLNQPEWMRTSPGEEVRELLQGGAKAILLYGPPRTGKTRLVDGLIPRDSPERCTIQIHDGWGYDHLVEGLKPTADGKWEWKNGPLKEAIASRKKYIVLEEINRTAISQALGEVFSLIEDAYRGETNAIVLRSGELFWIPAEVVFLMTMNTIDKSTEDVDDALMGRVSAVELPAPPEDLHEMLAANDIPVAMREKFAQLFGTILEIYPLGHGYFAGMHGPVDDEHAIRYYKARIRPVLANFFGELKMQELAKIDNVVDQLFGKR